MPQIKFTDTTVAKLKTDTTTWYSDATAKGLRLCVTAGGVKTWYCNKWDPKTQKVRQVKLAQWASKGTHSAWAKDQIGKVVLDVKEGRVKTKAETAVARAGIPTLREAFDKEMGFRRTRPASLGGAIHARTDDSYCRAFDKYLATWADDKMDEIDTAAIQRMLDDLVNEKPFAAHKVNVVLGITFKRAERMLNKPLPTLTPKLATLPKMQQREIDFTIPWSKRWAEIQAIENEHIRLLWQIRWFTGQREEMLRALKWSDIDLEAGTVMATTGQKKVKEKRLIAVADPVKGWFRRLWEIRFDDCDWVFPSRRRIGDLRGPLDRLDRLALTAPGDVRHLWDEATHDVDTREMVLRWLTGHTLDGAETKSLGFYGTVPVERQRKVANEIARVIERRCEASPANVVEMGRVRA